MSGRLYLGTSGWSYKDWGKHFYPKGLPARDQLAYIARHFPTVEINASFYRLPYAKTFQNWRDKTPPEFRFAVKVSRLITHTKRLADVKDNWVILLERSQPMGDKLAVFLVQFPPSFAATDETRQRFETFFGYALGDGRRLAFELRHKTWFEPDNLALFERHRACVVQAESSRYPHTPPGFAPADFTYYRFHGPRRLYASAYTDDELGYWAGLIRADLSHDKDVFVYFDNDVNGYALDDAKRLQRLLS
jgi:uncharacterized protein YecE (DUF72 family)